ncbi:MAG: L,D-transpeptidase family protein [Mucilaginibacter sp.]
MTVTTRNTFSLSLILFLAISLTFQSCKKSRSDMGQVLFLKTKNKVFKDVTPEGFAEVFKKVLAKDSSKMAYPGIIMAYYKQNEYDPTFVMDHLFNGDLKTTVISYQNAYLHGLDAKMFNADKMAALMNKLISQKDIKTLDEAYHVMAELELQSANSLIAYSNALQYGVINPKWIYARYYTETKRPDSASMSKVFHITNFKAYLDSIQPKDPQYLALQKALNDGAQADGISKEETKRALIVALERQRWKNKPTENKYVIVNIPDYTLDVMDSGKSVLHMKVCVGEGRNKTNSYSLAAYTDTAKIDKPFSHETPQLNSMIHSVQVNPVWNIPQSIVTKEIIKAAQDDKFYLANKGIEVYKNGDKIEDTESINWAAAAKDDSDYEFKQKPGDENSLGKIKFLFKNKSSVYLHDTPAKLAFKKADRDVSHGCVRLGDPQGLALNLFGPGEEYDTIAKDMASDKPNPTTIGLPKKTPVYITYVTTWIDATGTLQFRKDVYGLDVVLYNALVKTIM